MPDVTPSVLTNSVMAKIYDVLTNGDGEVVPKSEDNYFTWCTPGYPMEPADLEFLTQGLTGVIKKAAVDAATPTGAGTDPAQPGTTPPVLTEEEKEQFRAQDAGRMYQQAEALARLLDFVPDVSKASNEQFARLNVMNNEGSLSDVYKLTLTLSQVMSRELDEATKQKIEKARSALVTVRKTKSWDDSEGPEVTEPSRLVVAYNEKLQAYMQACLEYNNRRIDALVAKDQRAVHDWAINAGLYRLKVLNTLRDWETAGYKSDYEDISRFIAQSQAKDMKLLKEQYQDDLEKARLTGLASGSDFYYTSLVPGNFPNSTGWTRFSFAKGEMQSWSNKQTSSSFVSASGGGSLFGMFGGYAQHQHGEGRTEYNGTFNSDRFGLSFEICQIPIVRPWLKTSFLVSKSWRFDPQNPDVRSRMISDGAAPPQGLIPAYATTAVFIRRLHLDIDHTESFSSFLSEYTTSQTGGGGYVSFGPIFLGGGASSMSSGGSTTRRWGYKYDDQGLDVEGMQLIGFKCHLLPKSPDPDPAITDWV